MLGEVKLLKIIKKIAYIIMVLGLLIMCYEIIRVRTEYLKGYYNFTDLINGLSLIILASILIFITEILISYFSDWKSTSSHMKKGEHFSIGLGLFFISFFPFYRNNMNERKAASGSRNYRFHYLER